MQGGARNTSWRTNERLDNLILSLNSFEQVLCKTIKLGTSSDLHRLCLVGVRSQSPQVWEDDTLATFCQ